MRYTKQASTNWKDKDTPFFFFSPDQALEEVGLANIYQNICKHNSRHLKSDEMETLLTLGIVYKAGHLLHSSTEKEECLVGGVLA